MGGPMYQLLAIYNASSMEEVAVILQVMIYYHDSSSFVKKTLAPRTLQSIIDIIKGNLAEQDKTKLLLLDYHLSILVTV
ncbi:hypothetical protein EDM40_14845 [Staphylococcus aureus]|nr:hypothetical protein EDM40_14845 [Staphylococcus aureus]